MRYLSVCSGIEAASVAWEHLGWTPVGFSEIEAFPSAVLAHRYPNVPNYGDMTKYNEWPLEPGSIDLLVGGTPCQSFSVAGLRRGLADPRGGLLRTYLEIAQRLRPRWIVWENVPGVLSSNGGRDFGSFVGALGELGYGWAYRVLDAQWIRTQRFPLAIPQRRRRVFAVGCLGARTSASEVLFDGQSLRGDPAPGVPQEEGTAEAAGVDPSVGCWWNGGQVSQTLDAVLHKGQALPEKNRFPAVLRPRGFRKSKRAQSDTDYETWVEDGVANTLNKFDVGDVRTTHAVAERMTVRRLTPVESERLQGFPDNWTQIPFRGKKPEDCPDGPRYTAIGNSMAVNCMEWIGTRIHAVHSRTN
jgi:DNA (cytosine-5)-methyltransferase 1